MCISLDMDEVLVPGWRKALESMESDVTQVAYRYTWSWRDPKSRTQAQTVYITNKVHARHGYRWKYIVHEMPFPDRNDLHKSAYSEDFEIHHYSDIERSSTRYNQMIEDTLNENKEEKRYWVYQYECQLSENIEKAQNVIFEYLKKFKGDLSNEEIAKAYHALFMSNSVKYYKMLKKAHKLVPHIRDYVVDIAIVQFNRGHIRRARKYANMALDITTRKLDTSYREYVWGYLMKNMLYVCNHNLKFKNRNHKLDLNVGSMTSSSFYLFED